MMLIPKAASSLNIIILRSFGAISQLNHVVVAKIEVLATGQNMTPIVTHL